MSEILYRAIVLISYDIDFFFFFLQNVTLFFYIKYKLN